MSFRTTDAADHDIARIYADGVYGFGVRQAERYQDGLFDAFDLLADNPHLARERLELSPPVRLYPYVSHLIVYVIAGEDILIVRVLHGRSDWEHWLGSLSSTRSSAD